MCGSRGSRSAGKTHVYCTKPNCDLFDNPVSIKVWNYFSMLRQQTKKLLVWHLIEDGIAVQDKVTDGLGDRGEFYQSMGLTEADGRWTDQAYKTAKVARRS